jgi:PAS domain-containing protein
MDQILIFINNWGTIIAGIFTASGTIYLFVKRLMKKLKPHLEILDKLANLDKKIDSISKEFKPNSGNSVRDTLNLLAKDVKANTEITKRIENRQAFNADLSDIPMFETDSEGSCIAVNNAYVKLVQRPKTELLGGGWILAIVEETRDEVLKEWDVAVKTKRNFEKTLVLAGKDNQEYLVKCVAIRQSDSSGYLGYYSNITKA